MPRAFIATPSSRPERAAILGSAYHVSQSLHLPYTAPRDEVELRLTRLWEDLLALRGIVIDDDYSALGGHSLLAVALVGQIEEESGRDLPLTALDAAPTIAGLAAMLRGDQTVRPWTSLLVLQAGDERPPFCVGPATNWRTDWVGPGISGYRGESDGTLAIRKGRPKPVHHTRQSLGLRVGGARWRVRGNAVC